MIIRDRKAIKFALETVTSDIYGINRQVPPNSFGASFLVVLKKKIQIVVLNKVLDSAKAFTRAKVHLAGTEDNPILAISVPAKINATWRVPVTNIGVLKPKSSDKDTCTYLIKAEDIEYFKFNKGRRELEFQCKQEGACSDRIVFKFGSVLHSKIMNFLYYRLYWYRKDHEDKYKYDYEVTKEYVSNPNNLQWPDVYYLRSVAQKWRNYIYNVIKTRKATIVEYDN